MIYGYEPILPIHDVVFKEIFWNKEYPEVLISFINSILKRDSPITSIELGNTEFIAESNGKHSIRLDVVGKTSNNEILNIILHKCEDSFIKDSNMKKTYNDDTYKMYLYYWSKLYSEQLPAEQRCQELNPVITINILDFNLFDDKVCNRRFILRNPKTNEDYLKMMEIHFVELKKRQYIEDNDALFAWAEFLKSPNSKSLISKNPIIDIVLTAKEIFNKTLEDPIQREKIRLVDKTEMDNISSIASAYDKGFAEGLEKGKEERLKKEKQKKEKESALNMKK